MVPGALFVMRRETIRGPILTPGEINADYYQDQTVHTFSERPPQSTFPCHPSREHVTYFLSPVPDSEIMGDFLMAGEKMIVPFKPGIAPGRLSVADQRRNIRRPQTVSYGSAVGESDGVAPYGLE